jgi:hypothetical protein
MEHKFVQMGIRHEAKAVERNFTMAVCKRLIPVVAVSNLTDPKRSLAPTYRRSAIRVKFIKMGATFDHPQTSGVDLATTALMGSWKIYLARN